MNNDPGRKKRTVVIRTPDHRLRVFVSSTLHELGQERNAVRQAITKLHLSPVMFESGARPHPAQDVYQAYLSQSHIFIGIYWESYGWIAPGMQISGLEDEYIRSGDLPRLIYIKNPAPQQDPALTQMLERMRDENVSSYKRFTSADELEQLVEQDLILLLTEYFETARYEEDAPDDLIATTLTNLPIPRNPLIGRELELSTACSMLMLPDIALVTLTGPAGTGKSRLGIQVALELRDQFADGVYMVGLESVRDPALVIATITETVNMNEKAGGATLLEKLKAYLCNKNMLLLLDNFEQVLPAAPQVAELLEACPHVKILVTSRAPLHLRPEKELPIPPLKTPPLKETLDLAPLSQYSAVKLFIQRCQAVKADFQISTENAAAIAEICYRLDGLPLAIELAAARIKLLPPQALLSRLERRFDVLRGGTKDLPARQQTMYSAIDWSYNLLDENDKQLFRRLATFCGGWTVEAASVVCGGDDQGSFEVLDGLQSLLDNNLIRLSEEAAGETRLRMLECIHEFAFEQLDRDEAESVHDRYVNYYAAMAQQAEIGLQNSNQQIWHQRVDAELCNIRRVLSWAIEHNKSDIALRITLSLWKFWWAHAYWSEGFQWLATALEGSNGIPVELKAKALTQSGWYYRNLGDFPRAIDVLQQSLDLWQKIDGKSGYTQALYNLGASILRQGDIEGAKEYLEQALNLSREQGDTYSSCMSLEILGHAAAKEGKTVEAINLYTRALVLAEEMNDEDEMAKLLSNLGDEYVIAGDYDRGEEYLSRASALCRKHGNRTVGAYVSGNRSIIAIKKGNYSQAFDLLADTINVIHGMGDKEETILCLEPFAYIARETGDFKRAARLFGASETHRKNIGMTREKPFQADYDMNIAKLIRQLGKNEFDTAWNEGSRLTLDQAVMYALKRGEVDSHLIPVAKS